MNVLLEKLTDVEFDLVQFIKRNPGCSFLMLKFYRGKITQEMVASLVQRGNVNTKLNSKGHNMYFL